MLKIFENETGPWSAKTNFVDDMNMVVGYDTEQSCCEHCTHFFTQTDPESVEEYDKLSGRDLHADEILNKLRFDPEYFREYGWSNLDGGGAVAFRLLGDAEPWYLVIANSHNGYYGHGFTVEVGGVVTRKGCI